MRPTLFRRVLPFDEALRLTVESARPVDRLEEVPLHDLDGRVSAVDVTAVADVPPFDRAAVDGYAVVAADTAGATAGTPCTLTCVGALYTGEWTDTPLRSGQCLEIATGAPMPPGATAVVMVEHTARSGDAVDVHTAAVPGQHIGRRGSDMRAGAQVVTAGDAMTPGRVGVVAGAGLTALPVYARPRVAVISTGNEVVLPGMPLRPGQVHNINQFTLAAVIRRHGGIALPRPIAMDALSDLDQALDAISDCDIAVFSGGSSVGRRDLLVDAIGARGDILFHGIAVKPGKPAMLARVGRTVVMGMPGYPTSCLSNAYLLLVPLLRRTARLPAWTPRRQQAILTRRVTSTADRHQFYPVRVVGDQAEPAFKGSGDITSMANADGFFEIPQGVEHLDAGTPVMVTMFE